MILSAALAAALCTACANVTSEKGEKGATEVTHDGLHLVPHSRMQRAWVKPGEDFSQYTHVMLVDCLVSFKKNWKTSHPGLRAPDMDRFKKEIAEEFREVFTEELQKGGYPIVTKPDENALQVRAALINIGVTAPNTLEAKDETSFTASVGDMAIFVELFDSVSNEILARAIDRRAASHTADFKWTTKASGRDEAQRMLKRWAHLLVEKLDEAHGKKRG
jgi:hypothetical protein